jgi:hypothetical protein
MADGKACKNCDYQEAEHEITSSIIWGYADFADYDESREDREKRVKEDWPGICEEFIDPDPDDDEEETL